MQTLSNIVAFAIVQISLNHQKHTKNSRQKHQGIIVSSGHLAPSKAVAVATRFESFLALLSGQESYHLEWHNSQDSPCDSGNPRWYRNCHHQSWRSFKEETLRQYEMMTEWCWLTNLLTLHNKYKYYEVGFFAGPWQNDSNKLFPSCIWSRRSHFMWRTCVSFCSLQCDLMISSVNIMLSIWNFLKI